MYCLTALCCLPPPPHLFTQIRVRLQSLQKEQYEAHQEGGRDDTGNPAGILKAKVEAARRELRGAQV